MADYYYNDLGFKVWKAAPYKCYQRVCDEVFGEVFPVYPLDDDAELYRGKKQGVYDDLRYDNY